MLEPKYFVHVHQTEPLIQDKNSGVQPQAIMQALFSCTKHLIYPFTVTVKMKCGCVSNMLSSFWAFINICIYERKLGEVVTQLAKCREYLATHSAPENEMVKDKDTASQKRETNTVLTCYNQKHRTFISVV